MVVLLFRILFPTAYVPASLQNDETLWSGCISGAFEEKEFLQAFLDAGFVAVGYDKWDDQPWQVVEGIEFRSVTLLATKPEKDNLYDAGEAVLYRGPYSEVFDDLGNRYPRGERIAVSRRTFDLIKMALMPKRLCVYILRKMPTWVASLNLLVPCVL